MNKNELNCDIILMGKASQLTLGAGFGYAEVFATTVRPKA